MPPRAAAEQHAHSQDVGVAPLGETELLQQLLLVQDLQDGLFEHLHVCFQLGQAGGAGAQKGSVL